MALCKCGAPMIQKGNYMVCLHNCGYQRELIKPALSHAEALEEIKRLKGIIEKLVKELPHVACQPHQDTK